MASWMIHEEPWFPQLAEVSSLRLRSAIGSSGLRPRFRDAITFFTPISATAEGQDVPAFTIGGVGDPELRPEFSTEFEAGFDAGLFNERVGLELTYYDNRSRDALLFRRLAPSLGVGRWTTEDLVPGRFSFRSTSSTTRWRWSVTRRSREVEGYRMKLEG